MNKYIVTLGGGELRDFETLKMDEYIVNLGREQFNIDSPNILFIPTASNDSIRYQEVFKDIYEDKLGGKVEVLQLINENPDNDEIKEKIYNSHIIYIGGGSTSKLVKLLRENNIDNYLKDAYEKGIVLSGLSAGSIIWYEEGHSDSKMIDSNLDYYIKVDTLGFLKYGHCPHYNEEKRYADFQEYIKDKEKPYICIEDNCGIVYKNNSYKLIKSEENAKAFIVRYEDGKLLSKELENLEYNGIDELKI